MSKRNKHQIVYDANMIDPYTTFDCANDEFALETNESETQREELNDKFAQTIVRKYKSKTWTKQTANNRSEDKTFHYFRKLVMTNEKFQDRFVDFMIQLEDEYRLERVKIAERVLYKMKLPNEGLSGGANKWAGLYRTALAIGKSLAVRSGKIVDAKQSV